MSIGEVWESYQKSLEAAEAAESRCREIAFELARVRAEAEFWSRAAASALETYHQQREQSQDLVFGGQGSGLLRGTAAAV